MNKIILGDCLEKLKELEENSVDSIVCDPPYELGFMGKSWDSTGIANNKDMWAECLRVLKPGGHLLAFSGTRTYHRMASAIEDAGFEIRDMIEWVYGSGFPKSHNIGKNIEKIKVGGIKNLKQIGTKKGIKVETGTQGFSYSKEYVAGKSMGGKQISGDIPVYEINNEWEGWGTALKPSHESIVVAQKRLDSNSDIDYTISICQTLFAQIVKKSSELNLNEKTQQSIAQWVAEKNINTLEDLSEVMDMLQSELETNLNLNIVSSWLNILGEIWGAMSMFTTETKGSLTTELKILQSLEWENIFQNITQVKNNQTNGYSANVLNVENLLNAVKLKLKYILTHSAQENAISQGNNLNFAPSHEPICMARKPLAEKTVAENVLKYGTGGINIDESRVEGEPTPINKLENWSGFGQEKRPDYVQEINTQGRFPANIIHNNSEEVRECFPESTSGAKKANQENYNHEGKEFVATLGASVNEYEASSGNASRFFKSIIYQAKASKSERNKGCEGLEEKIQNNETTQSRTFNDRCLTCKKKFVGSDNTICHCPPELKITDKTVYTNKNNHPTVKPIALMEYLIKMVTPKGGTVLDPFAGSGSTLVAAKQNGFQYIGIEMTEEYIPIINARLGL